MSLLALILLSACGPTPLPSPADTADTSVPDDACGPLAFPEGVLDVAPATTTEVVVAGCASDFTATCPSWATLTLADPAVDGDVALVETLPGWSGPLDGVCTLESGDDVAELALHLLAL